MLDILSSSYISDYSKECTSAGSLFLYLVTFSGFLFYIHSHLRVITDSFQASLTSLGRSVTHCIPFLSFFIIIYLFIGLLLILKLDFSSFTLCPVVIRLKETASSLPKCMLCLLQNTLAWLFLKRKPFQNLAHTFLLFSILFPSFLFEMGCQNCT